MPPLQPSRSGASILTGPINPSRKRPERPSRRTRSLASAAPPALLRADLAGSENAPWLDADTAAQRLGVSKSTLYSYVSRGWLHAVPDPADPRARRYSAFELEQLARRAGPRRKQLQLTLAALTEGLPVLDTALSCIHQGQPIYRGRPALTMAQTESLESVARWLWLCEDRDPFAAPAPVLGPAWHTLARMIRRQPLHTRTLALLGTALADLDPAPDGDAGPQAIELHAAALLRTAVACFLGRTPSTVPIHRQFQRAWRLGPEAVEPLRQALVLAADHELNLVAFVGRVLASAEAPAPAALLGAMCTLGAHFNGGATAQVEALWDALTAEPDLSAAVAARLSRGESLAGFNHLAYPRGDPRAARLLGLAEAFAPAPALVPVVQRLAGWAPSIDFALVALRRALGAPRGAALALQLAGRCVGVLAHVLEQQRSGQRIIVRARYVGPLPEEDAA